jgi:hypothetical protein
MIVIPIKRESRITGDWFGPDTSRLKYARVFREVHGARSKEARSKLPPSRHAEDSPLRLSVAVARAEKK